MSRAQTVRRVLPPAALVAVFFLASWTASAQELPGSIRTEAAQDPQQCETFPHDYPVQAITVTRNGDRCVVDRRSPVPLLTTKRNGRAIWYLCNRCGDEVDLQIRRGKEADGSMSGKPFTDIFASCRRGVKVSDVLERTDIREGESRAISCDVKDARGIGGEIKYDVLVRRTGQGPNAWDTLDPELQIEEGNFFSGDVLQFVAIGAAVLAAALLGFALSRYLLRPSLR